MIEILVVVIIIGVMASSIAIKAFPDDRSRLRQEAERLGLLLAQARDEAFLSGHSITWSIQNQTYSFWKLNNERQWVPLTNNLALRSRTLPTTISLIDLTINATKVPLSQSVIFSPSGLNIPFSATLATQEYRVLLSGDSAGRIQIKDEN